MCIRTFRDNAIDADVLRDLTDEHLRELGLPLGARLKPETNPAEPTVDVQVQSPGLVSAQFLKG